MYFTFIITRTRISPNVIILARMIGMELIEIPYTAHSNIPRPKSVNIANEKS